MLKALRYCSIFCSYCSKLKDLIGIKSLMSNCTIHNQIMAKKHCYVLNSQIDQHEMID